MPLRKREKLERSSRTPTPGKKGKKTSQPLETIPVEDTISEEELAQNAPDAPKVIRPSDYRKAQKRFYETREEVDNAIQAALQLNTDAILTVKACLEDIKQELQKISTHLSRRT